MMGQTERQTDGQTDRRTSDRYIDPSPRTTVCEQCQLLYESQRATKGWLGSRVVRLRDSCAEGPGLKTQPRRCRVTVLGKLFTPIVPANSETGSSPLKGCEGNCRPGGKKWQPAAGFMTHITCRLTAKYLDQLRNPTLGNRVWATFTFLTCHENS